MNELLSLEGAENYYRRKLIENMANDKTFSQQCSSALIETSPIFFIIFFYWKQLLKKYVSKFTSPFSKQTFLGRTELRLI